MNISSKPQLNSESKPWYREFWAWFILSPLIVVAIVSSFTITLAVRGADDRVLDNYYKEGRMINVTMDQDVTARSLSLKAELHFDQALDELSLQLSMDEQGPAALLLELSHPAKAILDQTVVLTKVANHQYHAELPREDFNHRWYLRLTPHSLATQDVAWRLRGEIDFSSSTSVILQPE